jgi:hypothetical protein
MREPIMTLTQPRLVSASELSRLCNVPVQRLLKAINNGGISPDYTVLDNRMHLFSESRVAEIKAQLKAL